MPAGTVQTIIASASVPTEPYLKAAKSLQLAVDPEVSTLPWTANLPELILSPAMRAAIGGQAWLRAESRLETLLEEPVA